MKGVTVPDHSANFGGLIAALTKNGFLSENGVQVLRDLKRQRNYLTHSLFDLFAGRVPESVLPRTGPIPLDVDVFTEKARVLEDNMLGLSRIAEKAVARLESNALGEAETGRLIFRP